MSRPVRPRFATRLAVGASVAFLAVVASALTARPAGAARCQHVKATIVGTSGPDDIVGTEGRDVIAAWGGDDRISGLGGNDIICAGFGNDLVRGGAGRDSILGASGDDELRGNEANDRLNGQAGDDIVRGNKGNDLVRGGRRDGGDIAYGGPGYDICGARKAFYGCEQRYGDLFGNGP
jgi:Ca2+-binding RTX toxin-like protein